MHGGGGVRYSTEYISCERLRNVQAFHVVFNSTVSDIYHCTASAGMTYPVSNKCRCAKCSHRHFQRCREVSSLKSVSLLNGCNKPCAHKAGRGDTRITSDPSQQSFAYQIRLYETVIHVARCLSFAHGPCWCDI
jgi:hypothetical protein